MAVRRIRGRWWVDLRHNFIRYRKKSPLNTKGGAEAYEAMLRGRLARGESVFDSAAPTPDQTLKEFAASWLPTYSKETANRSSELRMKEIILERHILPSLGHLPLSRVRGKAIAEYKAAKLRSLSPKTVNNHLTVLRRCLASAEDWELIDEAPRIRPVKTVPPSFDFLSAEEVRRLLQDRAEPAWNAAAALAVHTGMRLGEVLASRWDDIDAGTRLLMVQRKVWNGEIGPPKTRSHPVPITASLLKRLRAACITSQPGLLFRRPDGRPFGHCMAADALHRICARQEVRPIGWHVLRHTCASHLAMAGVPLQEIRDLLGHSTIRMTERYAHLRPGFVIQSGRVARAIEDAFAEQPVANGQPVGTAIALPVPEVQAA